jgi:hypothetical protein
MTEKRPEQVSSDRLVLKPKATISVDQLAQKGGGASGVKKLPPEHGRTPRASTVPKDEVLPRKDEEQ